MTRNERNIRNSKRGRVKEENERSIFYAPFVFILMVLVFTLMNVGVKSTVMKALSVSPTGTAGRGALMFEEVRNTGAAFGLFNNNPELLIAVSLLALVIITASVLFFSKRMPLSLISPLSLLASGIAMNLFERISYGYVTDYIKFVSATDFPAFNCSDIMVVCGAIGLIFELMKTGKRN